jgi:hypothetical protein
MTSRMRPRGALAATGVRLTQGSRRVSIPGVPRACGNRTAGSGASPARKAGNEHREASSAGAASPGQSPCRGRIDSAHLFARPAR